MGTIAPPMASIPIAACSHATWLGAKMHARSPGDITVCSQSATSRMPCAYSRQVTATKSAVSFDARADGGRTMKRGASGVVLARSHTTFGAGTSSRCGVTSISVALGGLRASLRDR